MNQKPKALTKRELKDLLSEIYKQVSIKQSAACDSVPDSKLDSKDKIWAGYDKIREHISKAITELILVGGIEP